MGANSLTIDTWHSKQNVQVFSARALPIDQVEEVQLNSWIFQNLWKEND